MIYGLINSSPKIIDSTPFHQSYTTKIYGFLKWVCSTDNDKSSSDEGAITSYLLLPVFIHLLFMLSLSKSGGVGLNVFNSF